MPGRRVLVLEATFRDDRSNISSRPVRGPCGTIWELQLGYYPKICVSNMDACDILRVDANICVAIAPAFAINRQGITEAILLHKKQSEQFYPSHPSATLPHVDLYRLRYNGVKHLVCYIEIVDVCPRYADPRSISTRVFENPRRQLGMVGIQNQGATCYMNSLLQTLFHTRLFRRLVYEAPVEPLHANVAGPTEAGGTSQDVVAMSPREANGSDAPHANDIAPGCHVLSALQQLFCDMEGGQSATVSTKRLTASFGWNSNAAFDQHDVQELNRVLCDHLEERLKRTPMKDCMNNLFQGTTCTVIRAPGVGYEGKPRTETISDVQLPVDTGNIMDAFRKYCAEEHLTGENRYDVEGHGKQDAIKQTRFTRLPPVLHIQLLRFRLDRNGTKVKLNDRFSFGERLDLSEFVDPPAGRLNTSVLPAELAGSGIPPSTLATIRACRRAADDHLPATYVLHSVLVHRGTANTGHYYAYIRPNLGGGAATLRHAQGNGRHASRSLSGDVIEIDDGTEEAQQSSYRFARWHAMDKVEGTNLDAYTPPNDDYPKGSIFDDACDGRPLPTDPGLREWYKFNDDSVQPVSASEAIIDNFGEDGGMSAYYLVYVRESAVKDIMLGGLPEHDANEGCVVRSRVAPGTWSPFAAQAPALATRNGAAAGAVAKHTIDIDDIGANDGFDEGGRPTALRTAGPGRSGVADGDDDNRFYVDVAIPIPSRVVDRHNELAKREQEERERRLARGREEYSRRVCLLHVVTDAHLATSPFPTGLPDNPGLVLEHFPGEQAFRVPAKLTARFGDLYSIIGESLGLPPGQFRLYCMSTRVDDRLRVHSLVPSLRGDRWGQLAFDKDNSFGKKEVELIHDAAKITVQEALASPSLSKAVEVDGPSRNRSHVAGRVTKSRRPTSADEGASYDACVAWSLMLADPWCTYLTELQGEPMYCSHVSPLPASFPDAPYWLQNSTCAAELDLGESIVDSHVCIYAELLPTKAAFQWLEALGNAAAAGNPAGLSPSFPSNPHPYLVKLHRPLLRIVENARRWIPIMKSSLSRPVANHYSPQPFWQVDDPSVCEQTMHQHMCKEIALGEEHVLSADGDTVGLRLAFVYRYDPLLLCNGAACRSEADAAVPWRGANPFHYIGPILFSRQMTIGECRRTIAEWLGLLSSGASLTMMSMNGAMHTNDLALVDNIVLSGDPLIVGYDDCRRQLATDGEDDIASCPESTSSSLLSRLKRHLVRYVDLKKSPAALPALSLHNFCGMATAATMKSAVEFCDASRRVRVSMIGVSLQLASTDPPHFKEVPHAETQVTRMAPVPMNPALSVHRLFIDRSLSLTGIENKIIQLTKACAEEVISKSECVVPTSVVGALVAAVDRMANLRERMPSLLFGAAEGGSPTSMLPCPPLFLPGDVLNEGKWMHYETSTAIAEMLNARAHVMVAELVKWAINKICEDDSEGLPARVARAGKQEADEPASVRGSKLGTKRSTSSVLPSEHGHKRARLVGMTDAVEWQKLKSSVNLLLTGDDLCSILPSLREPIVDADHVQLHMPQGVDADYTITRIDDFDKILDGKLCPRTRGAGDKHTARGRDGKPWAWNPCNLLYEIIELPAKDAAKSTSLHCHWLGLDAVTFWSHESPLQSDCLSSLSFLLRGKGSLTQPEIESRIKRYLNMPPSYPVRLRLVVYRVVHFLMAMPGSHDIGGVKNTTPTQKSSGQANSLERFISQPVKLHTNRPKVTADSTPQSPWRTTCTPLCVVGGDATMSDIAGVITKSAAEKPDGNGALETILHHVVAVEPIPRLEPHFDEDLQAYSCGDTISSVVARMTSCPPPAASAGSDCRWLGITLHEEGRFGVGRPRQTSLVTSPLPTDTSLGISKPVTTQPTSLSSQPVLSGRLMLVPVCSSDTPRAILQYAYLRQCPANTELNVPSDDVLLSYWKLGLPSLLAFTQVSPDFLDTPVGLVDFLWNSLSSVVIRPPQRRRLTPASSTHQLYKLDNNDASSDDDRNEEDGVVRTPPRRSRNRSDSVESVSPLVPKRAAQQQVIPVDGGNDLCSVPTEDTASTRHLPQLMLPILSTQGTTALLPSALVRLPSTNSSFSRLRSSSVTGSCMLSTLGEQRFTLQSLEQAYEKAITNLRQAESSLSDTEEKVSSVCPIRSQRTLSSFKSATSRETGIIIKSPAVG